MSSWRVILPTGILLMAALAGCVQDGDPLDDNSDSEERMPPVDYTVPEPDPDLPILEFAARLPGAAPDVEIHVRVARPDIDEPVGVIVEFTPYRLLGQRQMLVEPMVDEPAGNFVNQFVKRGFAFAWADVRGTGDSSGCIDLRGSNDIADAYALTEWLGTRDWSNGKVGYIGASYPGSTAHIAALAGGEHLGGVIPVVASTSFYHYHHMGGVPYPNAQGTTIGGYTAFALGPTVNAHDGDHATSHASKTACPHAETLVERGVLDQSGEYTTWWHDRNLRWRVDDVQVPVLMAQGLQDWNVKPDHIAHYYNDLNTTKTLVAPQMGHQYPTVGNRDQGEEDGPFGWWWEFASAFFDETLNGVRTGLFDENIAYVQNTKGDWNLYETWPPQDASTLTLNLTDGGLTATGTPSGSASWQADPTTAHTPATDPTGTHDLHEGTYVALESEPLTRTWNATGVPQLQMTIVPTMQRVHLTAVLQYQGPDDEAWSRVNHGYLNPAFRDGLLDPQPVVAHEPISVAIDFYPQEDVYEEGGKLRLVISSTDGGSTVPEFDPGRITVPFDDEDQPARLVLPLSPHVHP